jgi:chromosome segregation ATPase
MLQDRIAQEEARIEPKLHPNDAFWTQLDILVARHESQMGLLSDRASELCSGLSAARKAASSAHVKRMDDARAELEALKEQIRQANAEIGNDNTGSLRAEEQNLRSRLSSISDAISEVTGSVSALQKSSAHLKVKSHTQKAEYDAKFKATKERSREAETRANQLSARIDAANQAIREIDDELEELAQRESTCLGLYNSLKQPLPVIHRIFAHGDLNKTIPF